MAESVQDSVWATRSRGCTARFPTAAATGQSSSITGSMYWHYIRQLLPIICKFCNELFDARRRWFHACMGPRTTIIWSSSHAAINTVQFVVGKFLEHSRIWVYYWSHEM
jgi:hypothetical protein